jgi:glycosyltransferase involved in cell wall biosynthesis
MMPTDTERPVFAIVSTDIRRDLVAPLRHFTRLRVVHFYGKASYGDLNPDDLDDSLIPYRTPVGLFRQLRRQDPAIIQGVEPFSIRLLPYSYAVYCVALQRRIPLVIVTLENRPLADKHGPVFSRLLRGLLRPVFHHAQLIIHLNEGARHNVLSVGPYKSKLRRLMYGTWGVDLTEFTPQRDGREPDFGSGPVLLFVGRLHAAKGIFDLLDAFGLVQQQVPQVRLVLVGDGPARSEVTHTVGQRGWSQDVVLKGTIKNQDLPPYFRSADLFASPSVTTRKWEEQVGMSNIQAMASGVPVISTRSGAIPEYVPDGVAGILLPQRDPKGLAHAIVSLLSDQTLRRKLGEAGRVYAVQHYDARKNVERAEEIILERCLSL